MFNLTSNQNNANVETITSKYFICQIGKNEKYVIRQEYRHFFGMTFLEGQPGNSL